MSKVMSITQAGESATDAAVLARAKSNMGIGIAADVELIGIGKYRLVAIGRCNPADHPVVLANHLA